MSSSDNAPPPPKVSPDGRFWWDGSSWVPFASEGPVAPPTGGAGSGRQPGASSPGPAVRSTGMWTTPISQLSPGVAIAGVVLVIIIVVILIRLLGA